MKTVEEVMLQWETDAEIDTNHLDKVAIDIPKLHAKYLRVLTESKLRLAKAQTDYETMRQIKFRYYRGELSRDELATYEWPQWQRTKPLKNEMDEFLRGDGDLNQLKTRVAYLQALVGAVESIMQEIRSRNWSVRNALEYRKFVAGS